MLLHPSHDIEFRHIAKWLLASIVIVALISFLPAPLGFSELANYAPVHTGLEVFSIVVAMLIFSVIWSTYPNNRNSNLLLLGLCFLAIAILDFSHMLFYPSLVAGTAPTEHTVHFWLAARTVAALGILVFALLPMQHALSFNKSIMLITTMFCVGAVHVFILIFPQLLLRTFIQSEGLTAFKINYAYVLVALNLAAVALFVAKLRLPRQLPVSAFAAATLITSVSGYFFALYTNIADSHNLAGHLFKIVAYLMFYRAIFAETVKAPYIQLEKAKKENDTILRALPSALANRDMNARMQGAQQIHLLNAAIEQSPYPLVITDLKANIIYANEAICKLTQYASAEIIGQNPRIFKSGQTPLSTYQDMWTKFLRKELWAGELINRKKDGSIYYEWAVIYPVRDQQGEVSHFIAHKEDISDRKATAAKLESLSQFDQLTGLPNRRQLVERFDQISTLAKRHDEVISIFWIDIDNFKVINDTLGHSVGDLFLREMAHRIREQLQDSDMLTRHSGDDFVAILPNITNSDAANIAMKICQALSETTIINDQTLSVTASVGIALYPNDSRTLETLLMNAESAMYQVKQQGRNSFRFYAPEMQEHTIRSLALNAALKAALINNELSLVYQPQYDFSQQRIIGVEALLRWHHHELGTVTPGEFIPLAEHNGLIVPMSDWVIRTAAKQLNEWQSQGIKNLTVAINLSAIQFNQPNLCNHIVSLLREFAIAPYNIELELTEAVALSNPLGAKCIITELKQAGFQLAIDDFGTGYSSMSYLKQFAVDKLKIDQSFIRELNNNKEDLAIVTATIQMASGLGLSTIAEGVETEAQYNLLRQLSCDQIQGYFIAKPMPPADLLNFIQSHQQLD